MVFDNIVIGAGPGGYRLAADLAAKGESVAIVERDRLGGTCLNRGCIPTKCLAATASANLAVLSAPKLGIEPFDVCINFPAAVERMRSVMDGLRDGVSSVLGKCQVINGDAGLTRLDSGSVAVKVGDETYEAAKRIIIATGSRPAVLPIPGAELAMTSDEALSLETLPASMVIVGGGVIGMEFASIFSALGVKVTVIEFCKEILPPFDSEVAKRLRTTLSRRGIDIITSAAVKSLVPNGDLIAVTYEGKRGEAVVEAEKVIMAVGRRPVLPDGLEEAGIKLTPKGFIEVDDMMRTSVPGIYAVGDVNGLSMLAHSAYAHGRVVAEEDPGLFNRDCVPSIVFTEPEVAMVGPTAAELQARGEDVTIIKRPFASNGKAQAMGHADGVLKMVARAGDGVLLSATIMGPHAADLIAEATLHVSYGTPVSKIPRTIHAHPTLSEIFC